MVRAVHLQNRIVKKDRKYPEVSRQEYQEVINRLDQVPKTMVSYTIYFFKKIFLNYDFRINNLKNFE